MLPWIKELREKWPEYRWPVFVALVIGGFCGFGIATFWWSGTVATLREHIALLQENRGRSQLKIVQVKEGPTYRVQPDDDVVQVDNQGNTSITILLPSGFARGKMVTVKDKKGNANTIPIRIMPESRTVDGLREFVIQTDRGWISMIWDGNGWSAD